MLSLLGPFFGWCSKAGQNLVGPLTQIGLAPRRHAETELVELRKQLQDMLNAIETSSTEAQAAVRGSPNEPNASDAQQNAINGSTLVGQKFASLIYNGELAANVPASLIEARRRYREVVADEENVDIVDPKQRPLRCAEIEAACAAFHVGVTDYAFAKWGLGLGRRAGKVAGRRLPK